MASSERYHLPPILVKPVWEVSEVITNPKHGKDHKLVVFDLETTGFSPIKNEITQIAATTIDTQKEFNVYILPKKQIPKEVVELTGLEVKVQNGVRCMFSNGRRVETVTLQEGLVSFIEFLKTVAGEGKVNLVGHNCLRFDMSFIYEALLRYNLCAEFHAVVGAAIDTLYVTKKAMPGRKSYRQQDLVRELFQEEYAAHDALEDVKSLAKLVSAIKKDYIQSHTYTLNSIITRLEFNRRKHKLVHSLYPLVNSKVLTESLAKKMAETGVGFAHLEAAHLHGKENGLRELLSQRNELDKPRVTKNSVIINTICAYFTEKYTSANDADSLADELANLKVKP